MRIPSGDLAPARRRRYGGSYGRRRRRNLRLVLAVLLVAAGAGAAYLLYDEDRSPDRVAGPAACPTPTATATALATPAPLQPRQVRLTLLNGTPRNGLAKAVAAQLAARGFVVTAQANAASALAGPSQVAYGPGSERAADLVARWVLGATIVSNPRVPHGAVQVTLGSGFHRLATPAEVAAATTPVATAAPSPTAGCAA